MNDYNNNCSGSQKLRAKATAFTRRRKLDATRLLQMIIYRVYTSLQLAVDIFYDFINENPVSKQAFSKARAGLNPDYVREYFDMSAKEFSTDESLARYRGKLLIAIDGTDISLENSEELKRDFGCSGPSKNAATALASVAYDPLNQVAFDCQIDKYGTSERALAMKHMDRLAELGLGGSILLMDRGYPSVELIASVMARGFSFVMRVKEKWDAEVDAIKTQGWREIEDYGVVRRIRVIKVKLPTGETETLLTDMDESQLSVGEAKAVYFRRWGIEVSYDTLKSKLQLENFSGKTKTSVLQDFYATMFILNLVNAVASISDDEITAADQGKELKYPRRANRNRAVSKLRNDLLRMMLEPNAEIRRIILDRIISLITRRPLSVVRNRDDAPPRKTPRKKRFHVAKKSVVN
jgi:hypothetical protein